MLNLRRMRKGPGEGCSLLGIAGDNKRSAVFLGNGVGDGKPKAVAAVVVGAGLVGSIKAIKHMGQILGGNCGAAIMHCKLDRSDALAQGDCYAAALVGVLAGIVEQRCRKPAHSQRIALYLYVIVEV